VYEVIQSWKINHHEKEILRSGIYHEQIVIHSGLMNLENKETQ
jgi:hypothetical protein